MVVVPTGRVAAQGGQSTSCTTALGDNASVHKLDEALQQGCGCAGQANTYGVVHLMKSIAQTLRTCPMQAVLQV